MKIDIVDVFDCTLEAFWQCFDDPDFEARVQSSSNARKSVVSDETRDGVQTLVQRFDVPMPNMPSAVRAALGTDTMSYEQTTTIDRARGHVTWSIKPAAMADRIRAHGVYTVKQVPTGVERALTGDVTVGIPFIGRSVEKMVVGAITQAYVAGTQARREWIASRG